MQFCAALSIARSISLSSRMYSYFPASARFLFRISKNSCAMSYSSCTVIGTVMTVSPSASALTGSSVRDVSVSTTVSRIHKVCFIFFIRILLFFKLIISCLHFLFYSIRYTRFCFQLSYSFGYEHNIFS